ncbi:type II toxin-antitoxin system VapC family toxin [Geminocystis sp. CENA526]|uniref:type II toxin-antitoxin system VapC family toxin n=1 Tax=Geminocystis sp. CENA526 TaxID=1355871 RepID=UPI003D6E6982
MKFIFLDSGILGMVSNPKTNKFNLDCQLWLDNLLVNKAHVIIPEIADYEVRRELIRGEKKASIKKLDELKNLLIYLPISTEVMLLAAHLWAEARQKGSPTADSKSLDGDVILASQAKLAEINGNSVIVATRNVKHLSLFVDAREWQNID